MITQMLLAGGRKKPKVTFLGYNSFQTNLSTYNFGNFTVPRKGLLVVIAYAIGSTAQTGNSITVNGSPISLSLTNPSANVWKYAAGCVEIAPGTYPISLILSGNNGGDPSANIGVYLIEDYISPIPTDANVAFNITTPAPNFSQTTEFNSGGVIIYGQTLSISSYPSGNVTYSSAVLDHTGLSRTGRQYSYAHIQDIRGASPHSETVTFATNVTQKYIIGMSF
mgnify:CR=1 FL=1